MPPSPRPRARSLASGLFTATITPHRKDLKPVSKAAWQPELALPDAATAQELLTACGADGGAGWYHPALVKALELPADVQIGQKA